MRRHQELFLHSASDLNAFLGCSHAVALSLRKLVNPECLPDRAVDDETAVLIQDAGHSHEAAYLAALRDETHVAEVANEGSIEDRAARTLEAMRAGEAVIYQATFFDPPWHGFADFIRRVDRPSTFGAWSYEVIDTKLARTASPKHIIQLGLYSDMIAKVQGERPHAMHLVLGDGREELFRAVEFKHTLDVSKDRYLNFIGDGAEGSTAEPCASCALCGWRDVCTEEWETIDHLSRVAGMQKSQIMKLRDAGVGTMAALAALPPGRRIPKLAPTTFERLRAQAVLQVARLTSEPTVEFLEIEEGRGFARLPAADPADLFFDLEGDPLHPDGLEYLWGVHWRDAEGTPNFRHEWAHDRENERVAFEAIVDWFTAHVAAHPAAHIYHYAAYEVAVLRRLSTAFASREAAVDALLRAEKFVDLYAVARSAIRTSEPNLSLKTLEIFFADKRAEDITKADQSIVHYHRWRETGERAFLDGILAYNRVDCENTEGLRDWLISLRPDLPWWTKPGPAPDPEKTGEAIAREAERAALRHAVRAGATALSERGRELMVHLIDFHSRAKKPEQWAVFDRCSRADDELIDDGECIGGIRPFAADWLRKEKRSTVARYSFPDQDTKLRVGSSVLHAPTLMPMGSIFAIDRDAGFVEVKRMLKGEETFPGGGALIPGWPLDTSVLEEAVARVAGVLATGNSTRYRVVVDLIERKRPRVTGWDSGPLIRSGETLINAATARALALDESMLFIQGPPGTGKTHTSAHMICSLIAAGKRVGVSSNSHKAVNNLLAKVETVAVELGLSFRGAKKVSGGDPETYLNGQMIVDVADAKDIEDDLPDLIGGTAWLFARAAMDQTLDYLFVDEAGQVSLGHLVAMGASTKNIILVGDQMQLGQPIQGAHPGESGLSVLDYLLQGAATIAPENGILLDTSWRMHPAICSFISSAVYDDRLLPHPDNTAQCLVLNATAHPALQPTGIRMIDMHHSGCSQHSDAEAVLAAELVDSLVGQKYVDRRGREASMDLDNILIVAPYNLQVNALKAKLPEGARVGTVDKFQGQEAEVVIVSLATSTPDDLPRHVDFFYSKNRLNVAISRARTLAIVLANPKLLELDARTVEHLRLVNTLAWLRSAAVGEGYGY
jgi:predicted RecB family nuclease